MWTLEIMLHPPHNDHMYKREHPHLLEFKVLGDRCRFLHDFLAFVHLQDSHFIRVPSDLSHHCFPHPSLLGLHPVVEVFQPVVKGSFNMLSDALHGERPTGFDTSCGPESRSSQ